MRLVFEQALTGSLLHQTLPLRRALPVREMQLIWHFGTKGLDVEVLVDEFNGLRLDAMPEQPAVAVHGFHAFTNRSQSFLVLGTGTQPEIG